MWDHIEEWLSYGCLSVILKVVYWQLDHTNNIKLDFKNLKLQFEDSPLFVLYVVTRLFTQKSLHFSTRVSTTKAKMG